MNKIKFIAFSFFILSVKFTFSQYLMYPDYDARLIQPLVNGLSHPHVCVAPDGWYYLTGTVGDPKEKYENDGIYLWKSKDLVNWQEMGKVFDVSEITWQSRGEPVYGTHHSKRRMGCRGAELHFVKGAYYLVYSTVYQSEWEILFGGQRFAAGHAGHATLFRGTDGKLYCTVFGSDSHSPVHQQLGIIEIDFDEDFNFIIKNTKIGY